jgi:hypothetical protein
VRGLTCEGCGAEFEARSDAVYCSHACRQRAYRERRRHVTDSAAAVSARGAGVASVTDDLAALREAARVRDFDAMTRLVSPLLRVKLDWSTSFADRWHTFTGRLLTAVQVRDAARIRAELSRLEALERRRAGTN